MLCEIYDDNFQLQLSISHRQLNADGEKYTIISNFHQLFTYPHSQWMTLAAILKGKQSDLSSVPQALTPACISIFIHILFFSPCFYKGTVYGPIKDQHLLLCTTSHPFSPIKCCLSSNSPLPLLPHQLFPFSLNYFHQHTNNLLFHSFYKKKTHTHKKKPFLTPFPFSTIIYPYRKSP